MSQEIQVPELGSVGLLRYGWRQLTSMRTALILLLLLGVASIPGSLIPQRTQNPIKVGEYFKNSPELYTWMDRFSLFDVYGSPWFSAIYILLFISLIGCVLPRTFEHFHAARALPPATPKNLDRMEHHSSWSAKGDELDKARAWFKSKRFRVLEKDGSNKQALKDQQELVRGPLADLVKQISADAKGSDKTLATELKKIFGGDLIDASGNSLAGKVMPATHPKGVSTYKPMGADAALNKDATAALAGAKAITGGKTIADLYNAYMGIGVQGSTTKSTAVAIPTESKYGGNTNNGGLETWAKQQIVAKNKLQPGQYFKYNGQTYKVDAGGYHYRQKALGGPFAAGQLMQINDRVNPLGAQQEGIMIKPDFSGVIYPNAATMPKYDIPSGRYSGYRNQSSGGSDSSAPVINNYITATPNMDIKQLAREVGMVTAKAVSRGGNNRGYSNGTQQVVNV